MYKSQTLQAFASGIHRSLVVDNKDVSPPWLLTQTDILRYVYHHPESLQALGIDVNKSIGELQVLPSSANADSVVTASSNELAVDVYKKMGDLKVAGVPIVDEYVSFMDMIWHCGNYDGYLIRLCI